MIAPVFDLGQTVATPAALEACEEANVAPSSLLLRHQGGDWGDVPPADARENERSLKYGWRMLSSYPLGEAGRKVWIITGQTGRARVCCCRASTEENVIERIFTSHWRSPLLADVSATIIGVSRGTPRRSPGYPYRMLRSLAPSDETWALKDLGEFEASYVRQLEALGAEKILTDLERIGSGRP